MLEHSILIMAVLTTTAAAYFLMYVGGRPRRSLRQALAEVMECIGLFIAFLAVNVALGVAAILLVRSLTPVFVSIYVMDNGALIIVSALQGFVFRLWQRAS